MRPELQKNASKRFAELGIRIQEGYYFTNCDVAKGPWYNYQVRLVGTKFGAPGCAYTGDDIVSPNKAVLPLQHRTKVNVSGPWHACMALERAPGRAPAA